MSHVLKLREVVVGRCDFADGAAAAGASRAPFRPGLGWGLVEPIFQLQGEGTDAATRSRYRKARDTLALALYARDGSLVETSRIDITADTSSPTGFWIEIHGVNRGR